MSGATCGRCGAPGAPAARYCTRCGAPLGGAADGERRAVVTVLFIDIVGSTALADRIDLARFREIQRRFLGVCGAAVNRHGGVVEKRLGDGVMAAFGLPAANEDDALRAVRAALDLRSDLAELNRALIREFGERLQIRTGIDSGRVVVGNAAESLAAGAPLAFAACLQAAADPDAILCGPATRRLIHGAVRTRPAHGSNVPDGAHEVLGPEAITGPLVERAAIGRSRELRFLRDALARISVTRAPQLLTVAGEAGIGKSHLVRAFAAGIDARVMVGRCRPYGPGGALQPLRDIVVGAAGLGEASLRAALEGHSDTRRLIPPLIALTSLHEPRMPDLEEIAWAARELVAHAARTGPVVVVAEDLHWAPAAFLDLLQNLAAQITGPVMVLCTARPDLREAGRSWEAHIDLGPLDRASAESLSHALGGDLPSDARLRAVATAEGNPLFLEQLIAQEREAPGTPLPPSVEALLAARIDRLDGTARILGERAAVIGREFSAHVAENLLDEEQREAMADALDALCDGGFIEPFSGPVDRATHRFRHALIRDAAYEAVPKLVRAELHERLAGWLEQSGFPDDRDALVGHHLAEAHRNRLERNPRDRRAPDLAARASMWLERAGAAALAIEDARSATVLLERALRLVPAGTAARASVLWRLGSARFMDGRLPLAISTQAEAMADAARSGDGRLLALARTARTLVVSLSDAGADPGPLLDALEEDRVLLGALGDDAGLAHVAFVEGNLRGNLGQYAAALEQLTIGLAHARAAEDARAELDLAYSVATPLLQGPTPVPEAIRRCALVLGETARPDRVRTGIGPKLGVLLAMAGRPDEGRAIARAAFADWERMGQEFRAAFDRLAAAEIERWAGDLDAAAGEVRLGLDVLRRLDADGFLCSHAGFLAEILAALGRNEEALERAELARRDAHAHDVDAQLRWRRATSVVLARRGDGPGAEVLAREALALAQRSDAPVDMADTQAVLALTLVASGRVDEAGCCRAAAEAAYAAKGIAPGISSRGSLARLA